jgi:tripartite-type tricarboxylate transporter receptor subunit TctC
MPKNSPREAIMKVNEAANAALKDERILKRLRELGGTPMPGTPEDFGKVIKAETDKWAPVVKASGAKVE